MLSLLNGNNKVDSEKNFNKRRDILKRYLKNSGLEVGLEGNIRCQTPKDKKPGRKFPFIAGFNPLGVEQLEKGIIDGIAVYPVLIMDGDYAGTEVTPISGRINPGNIEFKDGPRFANLQELRNYQQRFLKENSISYNAPISFASIFSSASEGILQRKYCGKSDENNPESNLYAGKFGDLYQQGLSPKGIFELEKRI